MIWELDILDQVITFGVSMALGGVLHIVYDIFRGIRRAGFMISPLKVFICDVLFWILSGFAVFTLMLIKTSGTVRSYMVLGLLAGVLIVRAAFSRFIVSAVSWTAKKAYIVLSFFVEKYGKMLNVAVKYIKKAENSIKMRITTKKTLETNRDSGV